MFCIDALVVSSTDLLFVSVPDAATATVLGLVLCLLVIPIFPLLVPRFAR